MASTYSNLKIQLMTTGENSTTWGSVTNTNLGTAIEEAITGSADVSFSNANVTLTLTDTNATQTARNMRLRCTNTTGGSTRNLVVPSIQKPYIIQNDCADSVQVKTAAGTGITVPAGKTMWVYANGTNVVDVVTHLSSLSLGTALVATGGGTGQNVYAVGDILYASTTTALSKLADVATGNALISGGVGVAPSYGKIALTTHVSGTLPVANGGTGVTTSTGTGSVVCSTSPTLVTPVLGTPTSGNLANCTFPTLNQNTTGTAGNVTGVVAIANGGTSATTAAGALAALGALGISASSLASDGYITLTNGLIIQWKNVSTNASTGTAFTWPIPFPTAVYVAVPGAKAGLTFSGSLSCYLSGVTTSGGTAWGNNGGSVSTTTSIIAIGK